MTALPEATLEQIVRRHDALQSEMATGSPAADAFVKMSKEYAELTPVVEGITRYRALCKELADLEAMAGDPAADADMRAMAADELVELKQRLPQGGIQRAVGGDDQIAPMLFRMIDHIG